jgi:hypothetical protein
MQLDPVVRIVTEQQIQNMIDDTDLYFNSEPTQEELDNLLEYLKNKGIKTPKMPEGERRTDVIKIMYRSWHNLETLGLMCGLLGETP